MHYDEMFRLNGKVAASTGGSRHLGFDMAEILSEAGCDVIITSRNLASAETSAERLREATDRDVLPLELEKPGRHSRQQ